MCLRRTALVLFLSMSFGRAPVPRVLPPGWDECAWRALASAVSSQPVLPAAPWDTHSRLADAAAEAVDASCLLLAFDRLSLPYTTPDGVWRHKPAPDGSPFVYKRFACAPSVAAWRRFEARLSPQQRVFYEVLREATPCRFFADVDLHLAADDDAPLLSLQRIAALLRACIPPAIHSLFELSSPSQQAPPVRVVCVDGGSSPSRVSLHAIACGCLLPNNEHAGAAVRAALLERIRAAAAAGDATAGALSRRADFEKIVDAINTKNRLRRLTGHTKIGQARHSAALADDDDVEEDGSSSKEDVSGKGNTAPPPKRAKPASPPDVGALGFASGAAAVDGEPLLTWKEGADAARLPPWLQPAARAGAAPAHPPCNVSPLQLAALCAEVDALPELTGAAIEQVKAPVDGKTPFWTVFTTCRRCPWREGETPPPGRAPGPSHTTSTLRVSLYWNKVAVGCTAKRHDQKLERKYASDANRAALFEERDELPDEGGYVWHAG